MIKLKDLIDTSNLKKGSNYIGKHKKLEESPDEICVGDECHSYYEDSVSDVCIIARFLDGVHYIVYKKQGDEVVTDSPFYNDKIEAWNNTDNSEKSNFIGVETHSDLKDYIKNVSGLRLYVEDGDRVTHSRIYDTSNGYVISFWEKHDVIKNNKSHIEKMLRDIGHDPKQLIYEVSNFDNHFFTYSQMFEDTVKKEPTTDDLSIELKQKLHLNPDLKKAFLKLPPNRLQKAADSLKMPLIQLKQMIGMEYSENIIKENMTYKQLMSYADDGRKDRAATVRVRSIPVSTENGAESWNFRYKSNPSVTDQPFQGSIQFFKEVKSSDDAQNMPVKVDCGCQDFKFRWAYNDTQNDASQVGQDSLNKAINRKPTPAYDFGVGLCKHLIALQRFLQTKIAGTKKNNIFEALDEVSKQKNFNIEYND